jgi:hypothetical protein
MIGEGKKKEWGSRGEVERIERWSVGVVEWREVR